MDIYIPIVICVIFFIVFSVCGWCCKRKREGTVYGFGPNVSTTSQHISASPVVVPPYPVEPHHPTPQPHAAPPAPGFAPHHNIPYPSCAPYPAGVPVYYPSPMGTSRPSPYPPPGQLYVPPGSAPYSPVPYQGDHAPQPPSYSEAVLQQPIQPPPMKEVYAKQAPYNPHF